MACTGKTYPILIEVAYSGQPHNCVADYKIAILQPVNPEFFATNKRSITGSIKLTGLRLF